MMSQKQRRILENILEKNSTLCLSTASKKGEPESALIYYATDKDLNFYFLTKEFTRKRKHLKENSNVSLLAFDQKSSQTVQIQGKAEEIKKEKDKMTAFDLLIKAGSQKIKDWPPPMGKVELGNVCLYKVIPSWIRVGNFQNTGEEVFEQLLG